MEAMRGMATHATPNTDGARYPPIDDVHELPIDDPAWRHVTINELTRRQFHDRGLHAITIRNSFDEARLHGDRRDERIQPPGFKD